MSMEEQRQRQEEEARRAAAQSAAEAGIPTPTADGKDSVGGGNLLHTVSEHFVFHFSAYVKRCKQCPT